MRLFRPIVVVLAGLALAMAGPVDAAVAAKGPFGFLGPKNKPFFVENPPDNRCFTMSQEAHGAHNGTDSPATIFSGKKCSGTAVRVAPGQRAPRDAAFSSVRFGGH
ncbi:MULTISPECIES: hypothetical protein [Streptomyces]|uniref:Uncharacterized protein n=1 Tax=Streptomyces mobaraensis (strain ATCC 29032 / DSM 40847 / JCM 4168 / NBRC 13819 / NCIMB 11159 / IPCR 16-22) TaxID=1223523 RepID=M3BMZ1_STRM1|nr:hypothetical protein [Streptomyces mobaraensis]EMF00955.1 hypothetical protein H340_08761 [Streptomyces mobaraensis NBRC 13819 = DSM 40847]